MGPRYLDPVAPSEDYEQHGWMCTYHHPRLCHNPLDCDLIPLWKLKHEIAIVQINAQEPTSKRVERMCLYCGTRFKIPDNNSKNPVSIETFTTADVPPPTSCIVTVGGKRIHECRKGVPQT